MWKVLTYDPERAQVVWTEHDVLNKGTNDFIYIMQLLKIYEVMHFQTAVCNYLLHWRRDKTELTSIEWYLVYTKFSLNNLVVTPTCCSLYRRSRMRAIALACRTAQLHSTVHHRPIAEDHRPKAPKGHQTHLILSALLAMQYRSTN